MTCSIRSALMLAVAVAIAAVPASGAAQINSENFAQLGFNFSPPGARSAGLGGAFIPLADDATAAATNPAGLTVLLYPQVSAEFKGVEYVRNLSEGAGGGPGGRNFTDQRAFPSFASVVYPTGPVSVALYRHELVDYRSTTAAIGYANPGGGYLFPYTSVLDLQVDNYGGAVAYQMGSLSLGLAAGMSAMSIGVDFSRYFVDRFEDGYLANRVAVADESGSGFFATAGVLYRIGEQATLGAVYKLRPKFKDIPFTKRNVRGQPFATDVGVIDTVFDLNVPDAVGVGIAFRPAELLTLAASAELIRYSQIPENQATAYRGFRGEDYVADDGIDLHLGGEYILFVGTTPVGVRAGAASLAPSNTYYDGSDDLEQRLWGTEPGDRSLSFSAGVGTVVRQMFQLDAAGVLGDKRKELVLSVVVLFGAR